jgi:hypothetical protein
VEGGVRWRAVCMGGGAEKRARERKRGREREEEEEEDKGGRERGGRTLHLASVVMALVSLHSSRSAGATSHFDGAGPGVGAAGVGTAGVGTAGVGTAGVGGAGPGGAGVGFAGGGAGDGFWRKGESAK